MQLKIKPAAVTVNDVYKYEIYDGKGTHLAKFSTDLTNPLQSALWDLNGHQLATLQRRVVFSLRAEFEVIVTGQGMLLVKKDWISPFDPIYTIEGPSVSYQLGGNWRGGDYSIFSSGAVVAHIKIEKASFLSYSYLVETADGADISTIVCLVVLLHQEQ